MMGTKDAATVLCSLLLLLSLSCEYSQAAESDYLQAQNTALLEVDASWKVARKIPQTLFGLFFEVHYIFSFLLTLNFLWISIA